MRFLPRCLFALLATAPSLAQAQTATAAVIPSVEAAPPEREGTGCGGGYSGYIKAGEKALAGASVFVKGTSVVLVTNELGFFVLPSSVVDWPTLAVSAMGYEPVAVTYQACEPVTVEMKVAAGAKFVKHGRKKGWVVPPKRKPIRR